MEKPKPKLVISISTTEKEKVRSFETTSEIFSSSSHNSSMVSILLHHNRPHRLLLDHTASESTQSRTHNGPFSNEANFDTNMVIILAALLCALICALGLNSIVRCALRCSRRLSSETPDQTAARLAGTGLKRSTLRQIPIVAYGTGGLNIIPSATDCPICLGEFSDGQKVRVLPKCNHSFHVRCIDTWLFSHSSCPTCRQSLLDAQPQGSDSPQNDVVVAVAGDEAG